MEQQSLHDSTSLSNHGLVHILSPQWKPTSQKKKFHSNYYCLLTMNLVTQKLWWRYTMRWMLFSYLLTQHCSAACGLSSNFDFQVVLFKKYISWRGMAKIAEQEDPELTSSHQNYSCLQSSDLWEQPEDNQKRFSTTKDNKEGITMRWVGGAET